MGKKHPLREALDLCDRALYPYVAREERLEAAERALRISDGGCSTAYTILAWERERIGDSWGALYLHERALAAAERAVADARVRRRARRRRLFRKPGEFPEAVAYARSRLALAKALRDDGRLAEAIAHARAVFDANEDEQTDPLGASVFLIPWLAEKERSDGVPSYPLPESVRISDILVWVGREDFQVLGPWGSKTDYELDHDRAQDILYDSYECPDWEADPDFRERSADEALSICPDMADAYVILGQVALEFDDDPEEAKRLFEEGVAAGEREVKKLLGEDAFERDRGDFYGTLETRGYVRARYNLLVLLYELGEKKAAEKHAREMLGLCRQGNLGLRYDLARWLHEQGREKELHNHLRRHNAFSRDPWKHDAGFADAAPEAMPERYWQIKSEIEEEFAILNGAGRR